MGTPEHCFVAPHPDLADRLKEGLDRLRSEAPETLAGYVGPVRKPRAIGLDDGTIIPPDEYPLGTPETVIRNAAMERAPLRGTVRVIVVLVDFSDKQLTATAQHFHDLFFSTGVLPNGSVKEYYREVTNGLVDIDGDVVGTYRMPQPLTWYANGNFGIGRPTGTTRARDLARDAAVAADPAVDFGPYDNDGNGFVDAFVIVHAGRGGEETGSPGDIWSHKWVLPAAYQADTTKIYGYLTIPEDAKLGVCAHELGHLLFGFPDLYDVDDTSEGIGNWCLMAGGSWNGGGDVPAHPSAWCKANQGWVSVTGVTTNQAVSIPDVKTSHNVLRLWKDGAAGSEYFLVENRQKTGYDARLPGEGLLIWHIDDAQPGNTDENHYKVGLVQADGRRDLELKHNRGDAGDPYPGSSGTTSFSHTTTPNSDSFAGVETCVSVTGISASAATMTASVTVRCGKSLLKDLKDRPKDRKDLPKDLKEPWKDRKDVRKEFKEPIKDRKDHLKELKEQEWPPIGRAPGEQGDLEAAVADLAARVAALEGQAAEPFIGAELRPDLIGGPDYGRETTSAAERMEAGDAAAKREYDSPPRS
ncbi:M6 family metalloprotease domain-containing protein [Amycolatopsis sp. Hca4]|uniref:M6 family metalloprotease domain-containing protein n=1 Tax=Amycolatopsis sp. Hca4 TaxID=2742131 RepID=UPI0015912FF5|nr:M6 family metalloprotease domain-containing protein [Amycolatopsis sp. Hca4]QKV72714.1 M6 family metalloprotease domain-containing protein [Amycolatopsis sp. Hca4]